MESCGRTDRPHRKGYKMIKKVNDGDRPLIKTVSIDSETSVLFANSWYGGTYIEIGFNDDTDKILSLNTDEFLELYDLMTELKREL